VAERRLSALVRENENETHALTFLGEVYSAIDPAEERGYLNRASDAPCHAVPCGSFAIPFANSSHARQLGRGA
jgi:hypothetical protein